MMMLARLRSFAAMAQKRDVHCSSYRARNPVPSMTSMEILRINTIDGNEQHKGRQCVSVRGPSAHP